MMENDTVSIKTGDKDIFQLRLPGDNVTTKITPTSTQLMSSSSNTSLLQLLTDTHSVILSDRGVLSLRSDEGVPVSMSIPSLLPVIQDGMVVFTGDDGLAKVKVDAGMKRKIMNKDNVVLTDGNMLVDMQLSGK